MPLEKSEVVSIVEKICQDDQNELGSKITKLNKLGRELSEGPDSQLSQEKIRLVEEAIENLIGAKLRELDEIRERNLEEVNFDDIDLLKDGFALLFSLIENILEWNPTERHSVEGVINRASLRAMMIDPRVSVKTKQEIMDNWEQYM